MVSWTWGCENGTAGHIPLFCNVGKIYSPSPCCQLQHSGEWSLHLTCTAEESWPYWKGCWWTDLKNVSWGDLAPPLIYHRVIWWCGQGRDDPLVSSLATCGRWESWPWGHKMGELALPRISSRTKKLVRAMLKSSSCWWRLGEPADQPCNCTGTEPELKLGPTQHPPYLWSAGAKKGVSPADLNLQDLHNTGQQYDIQKESQWGPSINRTAEARSHKIRPMTLWNEHLQAKMYG